jgi:hypothetical protein
MGVVLASGPKGQMFLAQLVGTAEAVPFQGFLGLQQRWNRDETETRN